MTKCYLIPVFKNIYSLERNIITITQNNIPNKIVIIDDGNDKIISKAIDQISGKHPIITVIKNHENKGLSHSLNKAIRKYDYDVYFRLDADDIELPERMNLQVNYLIQNPDVSVVGGNAILKFRRRDLVSQMPLKVGKNFIKRFPFCPIIHPTVAIRKKYFEKVGLYNERLKRCQDLDLWIRGINLDLKLANIPNCVIKYETNNYKRSWKSIYAKYKALKYIKGKHGIKNGPLKIEKDILKMIIRKVLP